MQPYIIDLNFLGSRGAIASYLFETRAGLVLIETGPATVIPNLVQALAQYGARPGDVRHILLTHIHFDHAGAAGWWAEQGAHVYVHHVGAPHLKDPGRLIKSATRIYGDDMDRLWGPILPVPEDQLTPLHDNDLITIGELAFEVWDTPGHAWHHHLFKLGDVAFTGDVTGVRYHGHISCPTPPPEFKRDVWYQSLDRVAAGEFQAIYPTHFGRIDNVEAHLVAVRRLLHEWSEFVRVRLEAELPRDQIVAEFVAANRARAMTDGFSEAEWLMCDDIFPHYMSVDGMIRFWRKRREKADTKS
jgi:glyoxylase-like metal-dependent hydrolase (beta-lactamase superfamily II)